jgi:hypothetical protein
MFWAHGFMQCPFAMSCAHELSFPAEETAIKKFMATQCQEGMKQQLRRRLACRNPKLPKHVKDTFHDSVILYICCMRTSKAVILKPQPILPSKIINQP